MLPLKVTTEAIKAFQWMVQALMGGVRLNQHPPNRPYKMDDMWTRKTFSLYSIPIPKHGGYVCTNHTHTSTYLVATKCLTYRHSNHLYYLPTSL